MTYPQNLRIVQYQTVFYNDRYGIEHKADLESAENFITFSGTKPYEYYGQSMPITLAIDERGCEYQKYPATDFGCSGRPWTYKDEHGKIHAWKENCTNYGRRAYLPIGTSKLAYHTVPTTKHWKKK